MTRKKAKQFFRKLMACLNRGTKDFGLAALMERLLRMELGGKAGYYLIPVASVATAAAAITAVYSIERCAQNNKVKKVYGSLSRIERFIAVDTMLEYSLFELVSSVFLVDKRTAILLVQIGAAPFAVLCAFRCKGKENLLIYKMPQLPPEILRGVSIDVEMSGVTVVSDVPQILSVFSLQDYKLFCATDDLMEDDNVSLRRYLFKNLWNRTGERRRAWMRAATSGGVFGSMGGFVGYCLLGFFDISSPIISILFAIVILAMASALGYEIDDINRLSLELKYSDLKSDPELWKKACEICCDFYSSRMGVISFFAKGIAVLNNWLLVVMGIMFMGNAPSSVNDENGGSDSLLVVIIALCLGTFSSIFSFFQVKDEQNQELQRTGTNALLGRQKSGVTVVEVKDGVSSPAPLPITAFKKEDLAGIEQYIVSRESPNDSPASSNSSDSPPRSLPVSSGLPIAEEVPRSASIAADEAHSKKHKRKWRPHFDFGRSGKAATTLETPLVSGADRAETDIEHQGAEAAPPGLAFSGAKG